MFINNYDEYSSIPLANPMHRCKKIYFVLIPLGTVALGLMGGLPGLLFGAVFGWGAAYLVMQMIAAIKTVGMNWKEYSIPAHLSYESLFAQLAYCKLPHDFQTEIKVNSAVFIFKNASTHRIQVHKKSHTYSIISRLKVSSFIKKRHNPAVKEYTYAFTAVPHIKQAIDETITILSQQITAEQLTIQENSGGRLC